MVFLSVTETVVVVLLLFAGATVHELGHYAIGAILGGRPRVTRRQLGLPAQVTLTRPGAVSPTGVRLFTGYVLVYPAAAIPALWTNELYVAAFALGGALSISAWDLLGLYHPRAWQRLADGDPIAAGDLKQPEFWE